MDTSVEFDGVLTPSCIKHLVFSFIKYVLYQRGQIPFQFDSLKKYSEATATKRVPSTSNGLNDMGWCHNADGIRQHQQQLVGIYERRAKLKQKGLGPMIHMDIFYIVT